MDAMKLLVATISACLLLCACESDTERMTAPPAEAGARPWLVPPVLQNQTEPPVARDESISSVGAVDVAIDGTQTNAATRNQAGRKGDAFFHSCRAGETIATVAKSYGVDANVTAKLNGWSASYAPAAGTMLLLPRNMENVAAAPDVTTYKVASGDTFSRVAKRHKISVVAMMALNKAKGEALSIGDVLYVPSAR